MTFSDAHHLLNIFNLSKVKRDVEIIKEKLQFTSIDVECIPIYIIHKPSLILNFKKFLEEKCCFNKEGDTIYILIKSTSENNKANKFKLNNVKRLNDKIKFDFTEVENIIREQDWFNFEEEEKVYPKTNYPYFTY